LRFSFALPALLSLPALFASSPLLPPRYPGVPATLNWGEFASHPIRAEIRKAVFLTYDHQRLIQDALSNCTIDPENEVKQERTPSEGDGPQYVSHYNRFSKSFKAFRSARNPRQRTALREKVEAEILEARAVLLRRLETSPCLIKEICSLRGAPYSDAAGGFVFDRPYFIYQMPGMEEGWPRLALKCPKRTSSLLWAQFDTSDYDGSKMLDTYFVVSNPRLEDPADGGSPMVWDIAYVMYASDQRSRVFYVADGRSPGKR